LAAEIRPDEPVVWFNLGVALSALGQTELASRDFREALRLKPDFAEAQQELARAARGTP